MCTSIIFYNVTRLKLCTDGSKLQHQNDSDIRLSNLFRANSRGLKGILRLVPRNMIDVNKLYNIGNIDMYQCVLASYVVY